jgi:thioredoxin 1
MNKAGKIAIIAALVVTVGVAITLKQNRSSPTTLPSDAVSDNDAAGIQGAQPVPLRTNTQPLEALPRLVDLGAGKCIPCKMMAPILEELKKEYAGILIVEFIDVWKNPEAGEEYGIRLIPTQIFYDSSGKELFRHEGFFAKEDILAKWKKLGVELTKTK